MYWRYELIPPALTKTITRLLFVGYAGIPMERCLNETNEDIIAQGTEDCLTAIHALGVLHTDAFANSILLQDGRVRIIDFERSRNVGEGGGA